MKELIVGAGSVGRSIARELARSKHNVTIIDHAPEAMKVASVSQADWILGDACEIQSLERAGAGETDVVVAATGDDKANLVVSLLCKTEFGVERAIARINNPKNEWLFDDSWGVDVAVSTPRIMTSLVEDAVSDGDLISVMTFQRSGASLMQVTLPKDAPVAGTPISQIFLPATVIINAIVRDGIPFPADPDLTLEAGDQALLLCAEGSEGDLDLVAELFSPMASPSQPE